MSHGVKTAIVIGGVIVGLIIVTSIISGAAWNWGSGSWGPGMMSGLGWVWRLLSTLFFLVVVALIIWAVVRAVGHSSPPPETKSGDSALEILRQRYARGEISREEYEAKRKDLAQ